MDNFLSSIKNHLSSKKYSNKRRNVIFSFLEKYENVKIAVLDERINHKKNCKEI